MGAATTDRLCASSDVSFANKKRQIYREIFAHDYMCMYTLSEVFDKCIILGLSQVFNVMWDIMHKLPVYFRE